MFRCMSAGAIGVSGSFYEILALARDTGFQGVDTSFGELAALSAEGGIGKVKDVVAEHGMRLGSVGLPGEWQGSDAEHAGLLERLPAMAALAAEAEVTGCATWMLPRSADRRFRQNFRWHAARLRPIAEILADHGLNLGLEFVGPRTSRDQKGYGFIYTIDGMLGLTECIGTGNVGLLLDAWHWFTTLGTAADILGLDACDVVHVHINDAPPGIDVAEQVDNVRALPGETGVIDLTAFLKALQQIGYTGAVSPEPFCAELAQLPSAAAAARAGAALGRVWAAAGL